MFQYPNMSGKGQFGPPSLAGFSPEPLCCQKKPQPNKQKKKVLYLVDFSLVLSLMSLKTYFTLVYVGQLSWVQNIEQIKKIEKPIVYFYYFFSLRGSVVSKLDIAGVVARNKLVLVALFISSIHYIWKSVQATHENHLRT